VELDDTRWRWVAVLILGLSVAVVKGAIGNERDDKGGAGVGGWPVSDMAAVGGPSVLGVDGWTDSARGFVRGVDGVPVVQAEDEPEIPAAKAGAVDEVAAGDPGGPPLSDVERIICSAGWPDCGKALRVARCESGPDYLAGAGTFHVGTWQIAWLHAHRFIRHGWDMATDGLDPYRNSVVAYEIYTESGWGPWPICQYR